MMILPGRLEQPGYDAGGLISGLKKLLIFSSISSFDGTPIEGSLGRRIAECPESRPGRRQRGHYGVSRVLSFRIPAACATHIIFHAFAAASSMAVSLSARLVACRVLGGVLVRSVGRAMACSALGFSLGVLTSDLRPMLKMTRKHGQVPAKTPFTKERRMNEGSRKPQLADGEPELPNASADWALNAVICVMGLNFRNFTGRPKSDVKIDVRHTESQTLHCFSPSLTWPRQTQCVSPLSCPQNFGLLYSLTSTFLTLSVYPPRTAFSRLRHQNRLWRNIEHFVSAFIVSATITTTSTRTGTTTCAPYSGSRPAAYYVEVLTVEHTDSRHEVEPWTVSVPSVEEVLIREAVEGEGWIAEPEKEKFMDQLLTGDEDAMVTLMILRMPNLKRLTLPTHCWGGLDFKHLMPIVAYIAQTASTADPGAGATLPLSQLEHYEGYLFNGSYGVDFEAIAPLMALPSLRTMCTPCNTEQGSGRRRYPNLACARSTFRMPGVKEKFGKMASASGKASTSKKALHQGICQRQRGRGGIQGTY
ncbi:hypothetical protein B0H14DRAFT_3718556 [Mycena olivaceomarginata]|nr:hypothetical protein B0H14DRAFT_3718556 [Mycena olivaceomarginata]